MNETTFSASCPLPMRSYPRITLAHGGGGSLTNELVDNLFAKAFADPELNARHDGATLEVGAERIAFSTDTHVVSPLFFPGGDIGKLAVCGTVNDLAMCGARPIALSVGLVLEEGLPMETLRRVVESMRATAREIGVRIVTGDTKVVEHGKGDGIYINTSGVGLIVCPNRVGPRSIQPGDAVVLSGDIGRHGIAVMAAREGLEFETGIASDCASLAAMTLALFQADIEVHCLRDLTRGGLATALVEIARNGGRGIEISDSLVPTLPEVEAACELLGLDPLFVANEGRCIAIVPEAEADRVVAIMRRFDGGQGAIRIGSVLSIDQPALATARTELGTRRMLSLFSGEQLPRIC